MAGMLDSVLDVKLRIAEEHVSVGPGRRVAVHRSAPLEDARVVVLCHPAPGAGLFDPDPEATRKRGVALISVDRPGYGGSDPVPAGRWATVGSAVDDLEAVLDAFDLSQVGVAGWSAGGRVALALAARRPELVDRVVVLATPAPDKEVEWVPRDVRGVLETLRGLAPEKAQVELESGFGDVSAIDVRLEEVLWWLGAGAADTAALETPGIRERLRCMVDDAFAQGAAGLASDIAGQMLRPWGFEPEDVRAKTLLLYGSLDVVAPPRHGRWWQRRLPRARLETCPGAGHLLALPMWPRVLSHLAPARKDRNSAVGAGVDEFSAA
jgi:pimeloyl-ACP methyl ester carboxylesterase